MLKRLICMGVALLLCFAMLPTQTEATEALPAPIEEAIAQWKEELRTRYSPLQLAFSQETELVKVRYLRVDLRCTLSNEPSSDTFTLKQSFHASVHSGKLLTLEDFLIHGGSALLHSELTEETGADASIVNWKLTEDGLTLYPSRGIGAIGLELTEDVLSQVLIWDGSVTWRNRPVLALTFDDGPSEKTPRLLDILETHGVRATFFVVGNMIGGREDILQKMQSKGHEVGGHSWNHANLSELSWDSVYSQLLRTKNSIEAATGATSCLMRPPYGASNGTVSSAAASLGLSVTFWNIDTLDWLYLDADKVYDVILSEAKNGRVVLCHDLYESTIDAIERVIPELLKQGYQLVTVSELRSR